MPSPFPGMDPWLENIGAWHGVHTRLIARSSELLQPQAKDQGFFVEVEERIYVEESELRVLASHHGTSSAVLEADEPVRDRFLQIVDTSGRKLVTQIELISHTNKSTKLGREQYLQKRAELKGAGVHIVEIDLLRAGKPVVDLPMESCRQAQPCDYIACVLRHGQSKREAYPIRLRERLPRIGIPLHEGFTDIVLDLQAALDHVWDHGPYPDRIDYAADPVPTLSDDDATWADEVLRKAGLRQ